MSTKADWIEGRVIVDLGRDFLVETATRKQLACTRRGKRQDVACGDQVMLQMSSESQGVIESIVQRKNVLYRSDQWKEKTLAANIDQVLVIIAPKPSFSDTFLWLCLLACDAAGIPVTIALNKSDLTEEFVRAKQRMVYLEASGYPVIPLSAKTDIAPIVPTLDGKVTLLVGQSGMGKSKIVNALVLDQIAREGELSEALDSGKHTTTFTRLYRLPHLAKGSAIIDSPGFQTFGLFHLNDPDIAAAMREFRPYLGQCKYANCAHLEEPHCAIHAAHQAKVISSSRLAFYQALLSEHRELHKQHPEWRK